VSNVEKCKIAEKDLRHAAEQWDKTFNSILDFIFILDKDSRFVRANKSFTAAFKLEEKDLIGKKCHEIFHGTDTHWPNCPAQKTFMDKNSHTEEVNDPNVGVQLLITTSPVLDDKGEVVQIVHIAKDISEQKVAENSLKKYTNELEALNDKIRGKMNEIQEKDQRLLNTAINLKDSNMRLDTIIQQMGEGIIVINEKKEIELINKRAKEMLGYKGDQKIPASYKKFFVLQLWKELHESNQLILKKDMKLERPREMEISVVLARLSEKESQGGFVAVMRDITFEKEVERMKSDFVANVSHEIRSPMAPMKDALGLVLDETAGPLNEKQKKFLLLLDNNMNRLVRLINDLLDLSKIEAGKMPINKEMINIGYVVKDTVESIRLYATKKNIDLAIKVEKALPQISCDIDRITQVIVNLVMNAIKFTPEDGKIRIKIECPKGKNKKFIEVSIKDTGPGMTQERADLLFNRFKQLVSPSAVKGTGLGLSISKAIIEMHGGAIQLESKPGKGSTFKFTLPI
tara:strand:- start:683 stop:2227 length:1545 start_codon:yes stop_codon:yes gene_type:complete